MKSNHFLQKILIKSASFLFLLVFIPWSIKGAHAAGINAQKKANLTVFLEIASKELTDLEQDVLNLYDANFVKKLNEISDRLYREIVASHHEFQKDSAQAFLYAVAFLVHPSQRELFGRGYSLDAYKNNVANFFHSLNQKLLEDAAKELFHDASIKNKSGLSIEEVIGNYFEQEVVSAQPEILKKLNALEQALKKLRFSFWES